VDRVVISRARIRKWSLLLAALLTGLFGLLVVNWNLMWSIPPATLEGAWLWPLAIVPLVVSFLFLRRWLALRRSNLVEDPPSD